MTTYASKELSKQLAHLFEDAEEWYVFVNGKWEKISNARNIKGAEHYPALTTDMLLEKLPERIGHEKAYNMWLSISKRVEMYCVWYGEVVRNDKSLPNALAKMLVYLDKEKLI